MKSFIALNKHFLVLGLIFLISEIIVNPIGDFPLNDDWTYGKSVLIYLNEGRIDIGNFAAMSLFTHIMWGVFFTKFFWFSFSVLRFSTLIASFIGIAFFYKLILRISENKNLAFFAALVLLFNPLYFNLTNTYMTDVNFNTLLILCCYFACDFFKTENRLSFILVFIFSLILVLVRQFGIIVPVCFTFAVLFTKQKKSIFSLLAVVLSVTVFVIFKKYEGFLRTTISPNAAYKYSSDTQLFSFVFWDTFYYNLKLRYDHILLNLIIYTSPFLLVYTKQIVKSFNFLVIIIILGLNCALVYYLFKDTSFPYGNVFTNLSIGAETFYETLYFPLKSPQEHTFSGHFETLLSVLKYVLASITFTIIALLTFKGIKLKANPLKINPTLIFFITVFLTYILMMLITESYFDRYHLPIITLLILTISFLPDKQNLNYSMISMMLAFFFYLSVFGTKDYLELNRKRWEAYIYLKDTEKINPDKINGGFEVNCWNLGKSTWWADFQNINAYDYLIQYRNEPEFAIYKEFEFQRYCPYEKDKIYIFVRKDKNVGL